MAWIALFVIVALLCFSVCGLHRVSLYSLCVRVLCVVRVLLCCVLLLSCVACWCDRVCLCLRCADVCILMLVGVLRRVSRHF